MRLSIRHTPGASSGGLPPTKATEFHRLPGGYIVFHSFIVLMNPVFGLISDIFYFVEKKKIICFHDESIKIREGNFNMAVTVANYSPPDMNTINNRVEEADSILGSSSTPHPSSSI